MKAFDNSEFEKHKSEARERWGKTEAYKEYAEKTKEYENDKWNNLAEEMNDILADGTAGFICKAIEVYCSGQRTI